MYATVVVVELGDLELWPYLTNNILLLYMLCCCYYCPRSPLGSWPLAPPVSCLSESTTSSEGWKLERNLPRSYYYITPSPRWRCVGAENLHCSHRGRYWPELWANHHVSGYRHRPGRREGGGAFFLMERAQKYFLCDNNQIQTLTMSFFVVVSLILPANCCSSFRNAPKSSNESCCW